MFNLPKINMQHAKKGVSAGAIIGIVIAVVVGGIVFFDLASDVYDEATDYNDSHGGTAGRMAVLFGGTLFVILGIVAIFNKAGML